MDRRFTIAALVAALALLAATAFAPSAGASGRREAGRHDRARPDTIDLPDGFQGEGVAVGDDDTFYAGSRIDGRVARGDLGAGTSEVLVATPLMPVAVGLKADVRHGLLWVAGGPTGQAAVYDLETGAPVVALTLTTQTSFINDVTLTRDAAYFTNSVMPELYRVPVARDGTVGTPETIALQGPAAQFVDGFNLNGIAADRAGRALVVVNSATGLLYRVDPDSGTSTVVDLGGASVATGDGILLVGRTLYVVQNGTVPGVPNQILVVRVSHDLSSGRVVGVITSPLFETATTVAKAGDTLVAVNAQFAGAPIDPEAEVVLLDRHDGHGRHDQDDHADLER